MNKRSFASLKETERVKSLTKTPSEGSSKSTKKMKAANNTLPVGMGQDKTAHIIKLLDTVSQQLRRSETERELLWKELEEARRKIADIEDRTDKSEKSYHFMRQEVEKTQQEGQTFIEQLKAVDSRAMNAVERIEEITEENTRITHKMDRISQDKTRLNRKLNIIEESVVNTREALESKALVLLTDKSVAMQSALPRIEGSDIFGEADNHTPAKSPENIHEEETRLIRKKLFGGASIVTLMVLGVAGVWGFMHFGGSLQTEPEVYQQVSAQDQALSEDEIIRNYINTIGAQNQAVSENESLSVSDLDEKISSTLQANGGDMNSVADMMNAIEPSAIKSETVLQELQASSNVDVQESIYQAPERTVEQISPIQNARIEPQFSSTQMDEIEQESVSNIFGQQPEINLSERLKTDSRLSGLGAEIEAAAFGGHPEAQHDLAALYTAGQDGVPQDFERAVFWFTESAYANVANARYNLGVLYHQGLGVNEDISKAIELYRSAALLGHPEAQYNLGIAYAEGVGVPYILEAAVHYFEKSAVGGIPESAYNLGLIYENGLNGRTDVNRALFWYNWAADRNSSDAQNALSQLTAKVGLSSTEVQDIIAAETETASFLNNGENASSALPSPQVQETLPQQIVESVQASAPRESDIIDVRNVIPEGAEYNLIAPIQEHLMALGLYPGPADGINGPMTEDAIRAYQTMFELQPTGKASSFLVEHMLNNTASAAGR